MNKDNSSITKNVYLTNVFFFNNYYNINQIEVLMPLITYVYQIIKNNFFNFQYLIGVLGLLFLYVDTYNYLHF